MISASFASLACARRRVLVVRLTIRLTCKKIAITINNVSSSDNSHLPWIPRHGIKRRARINNVTIAAVCFRFRFSLIKIQFRSIVRALPTDRTRNSQRLGRCDFDGSDGSKIPLPLHSGCLSCFLASPRYRARPTFFPFSTRQFFRLAIQFEMQKSIPPEHPRPNPESGMSSSSSVNSLDSLRYFSRVPSLLSHGFDSSCRHET